MSGKSRDTFPCEFQLIEARNDDRGQGGAGIAEFAHGAGLVFVVNGYGDFSVQIKANGC